MGGSHVSIGQRCGRVRDAPAWSVRLAAVTVTIAVLVGLGLASDALGEAAPGAEEGSWQLDAETSAEVSIIGELAAEGGEGLLSEWREADGFELEAAEVRVELETWEGERVVLPTGDEVWHQRSHERTNRTFEQARVDLETWDAPGVVLVEPSPGAEARGSIGDLDGSGPSEASTGPTSPTSPGSPGSRGPWIGGGRAGGHRGRDAGLDGPSRG